MSAFIHSSSNVNIGDNTWFHRQARRTSKKWNENKKLKRIKECHPGIKYVNSIVQHLGYLHTNDVIPNCHNLFIVKIASIQVDRPGGAVARPWLGWSWVRWFGVPLNQTLGISLSHLSLGYLTLGPFHQQPPHFFLQFFLKETKQQIKRKLKIFLQKYFIICPSQIANSFLLSHWGT